MTSTHHASIPPLPTSPGHAAPVALVAQLDALEGPPVEGGTSTSPGTTSPGKTPAEDHSLLETVFDGSSPLLLMGMALIVLSIWMTLRSRMKKRQEQADASPRDAVSHATQLRGIHGDMESLMVEIEQFARRMSAQLDAKAVHLEQLIEDADDRLAALRKAEAAAKRREAAGASGAASARVSGATSGAASGVTSGVTSGVGSGVSSGGGAGDDAARRIARSVIPMVQAPDAEGAAEAPSPMPLHAPGQAGGPPSDAGGAGASTSSSSVDVDPLVREVYQLADAGRDAAQIARQLNEHVGKVELILALRRTG